MKHLKKSLLFLLLCVCLQAAPVQDSSRVTVLWIPLGIWPLCALGIQMPGCVYAMSQPKIWLKIVEADGAIISQEIIYDGRN